MLLTMIAKPAMLAVELAHYVTKPVSMNVASLIIGQLGDPAYRSSRLACWYGEAVFLEAHGPIMIEVGRVPFSLTVDTTGHATLRHRMDEGHLMLNVVAGLVPELVAHVMRA